MHHIWFGFTFNIADSTTSLWRDDQGAVPLYSICEYNIAPQFVAAAWAPSLWLALPMGDLRLANTQALRNKNILPAEASMLNTDLCSEYRRKARILVRNATD